MIFDKKKALYLINWIRKATIRNLGNIETDLPIHNDAIVRETSPKLAIKVPV